MTAKPPPVPAENRSPKGTGEEKTVSLDEHSHGGTEIDAPDKRGQQGNTKVNTTPLKSQQDR